MLAIAAPQEASVIEESSVTEQVQVIPTCHDASCQSIMLHDQCFFCEEWFCTEHLLRLEGWCQFHKNACSACIEQHKVQIWRFEQRH